MERANEIVSGIKSFISQIYIKKDEITKLEIEERGHGESEIALGDDSQQKQNTTPTPKSDSGSEDSTKSWAKQKEN